MWPPDFPKRVAENVGLFFFGNGRFNAGEKTEIYIPGTVFFLVSW